MRIIHLYIWILGILVIGVILLNTMQTEGFSVSQAPTLAAPTPVVTLSPTGTSAYNTTGRFWGIVDSKTDPVIAAKILRVSNPDPADPNDPMPLEFPQYISMYALARFNNDLSGARLALINDYDTIQTEMSTNLYDQTTVNNWNNRPNEISCGIINNLRENIVRLKVSSISDSSVVGASRINIATAIQEENINYQVRLQSQCNNPNSLSTACRNLATQNDTLFPLVSSYNNVNETLFTNESDLSANIDVVNQAFTILGCSGGDTNPKFNALNLGIDTSELTSKLKQLSPYYISPDAIRFVIGNIISGNTVNTTLETTSDRLMNITKILLNMKTNLVG